MQLKYSPCKFIAVHFDWYIYYYHLQLLLPAPNDIPSTKWTTNKKNNNECDKVGGGGDIWVAVQYCNRNNENLTKSYWCEHSFCCSPLLSCIRDHRIYNNTLVCLARLVSRQTWVITTHDSGHCYLLSLHGKIQHTMNITRALLTINEHRCYRSGYFV